MGGGGGGGGGKAEKGWWPCSVKQAIDTETKYMIICEQATDFRRYCVGHECVCVCWGRGGGGGNSRI